MLKGLSRAPHPSILCPCRASSLTSSGRQLRREWTITLSSSYSLPLWKVGSQDLAGFPPQHCVRVLWICHSPAPGQLGVGVAFPGLPSISIRSHPIMSPHFLLWALLIPFLVLTPGNKTLSSWEIFVHFVYCPNSANLPKIYMRARAGPTTSVPLLY
jgi:hypothetical protein